MVTPDNPHAVQIDGASIHDNESGLIYEATVGQRDGTVWLESLTILVTRPGQRIDRDVLARIPAQRLAEQVSLHLAAQGRERSGALVASLKPRRGKHDLPTVEEVVTEWKAGGTRADLAARLGTTTHVVDRRLREARDLRLIPKATTGRKQAKTSGQSSPGTDN